MINPLVSICCITYNQDRYIRNAIEGFLMQKTTFTYEIIIHDDASTDSTQKIIKEYVGKNTHIIPILRTTNIKSKGVAVFPITFEKARGKYIAICEGDDYWTDPYKLQKQVDFMESNKCVSLCYHKVLIPNKKIDHKKFTIQNSVSTTFIPTSSILIRNNNLIIKNFIYHSKSIISGDQFLFYLCSFVGEIKFMNFIGGIYNQNQQGISSKTGIRSMEWDLNRVYMFAKLLKLAPQHKKRKVLKDAQSSLFNALEHSKSLPFIKYKLDAIMILILGLIFFPKYSLFRAKSIIMDKRL